MSTYVVEIEGKYDLDQINLEIAGEEAGASQFVGSAVTPVGTTPTNAVTFEKLSAGALPKALKLLKQNDPKPDGTVEVWAGTMIVSGTITALKAYRKS